MRTFFASQNFFDVTHSHYHFTTHKPAKFTQPAFIRVTAITTYNISLIHAYLVRTRLHKKPSSRLLQLQKMPNISHSRVAIILRRGRIINDNFFATDSLLPSIA